MLVDDSNHHCLIFVATGEQSWKSCNHRTHRLRNILGISLCFVVFKLENNLLQIVWPNQTKHFTHKYFDPPPEILTSNNFWLPG